MRVTGTPATATPTRVATNRQPSPRRIGYRASQPSRSSRRAWLLAATSLQPIAHRHASNGAGPTLDSHDSPAIVPQPGRNTRVIPTLRQQARAREQPASAPAAHHDSKGA